MQAYADALPLAFGRADEPRSRQAVTRSVQDHGDVLDFDKPESGRDRHLRNHKEVGVDTVVVAIAWLAFYVVAAVGADISQTHRNFVGLDIFEMHRNIRNLPVQKVQDMSVVFSNGD